MKKATIFILMGVALLLLVYWKHKNCPACQQRLSAIKAAAFGGGANV
jgi:hypothetical protein